EMSSINPVFVMPGALKANAEKIAQGFVASLVGSAGQLCTNPGLVIGVDSPELDKFIETAKAGVTATPASTMLTPGIYKAYQSGVAELTGNKKVQLVARGQSSEAPNQCQATLLTTTADAFIKDPEGLGLEVFGASSMVIKCANAEQMLDIVEAIEGQLTATLHLAAGQDEALIASLIPALELKVGRILANGYPTGVEVGHAMVHGGPFPATSDSRTTSVGSAAIYRFLRPVSYQDIPDAYLPEALKNGNPWGVPRMENK
ncbi:MAG TPA: aldehyde dehydrogenase family protein, partial [Eoetvoesiella sp.]